MFDHTPSDKVQFRALGELQAPGTCLVCGSGTREEGYIDLAVYVDYLGTAYLCVTCLIQAAEVIGMITSDEARIVNGQMSALLTENAALKATIEENDERLAAFDLLFNGAVAASTRVSSISGGDTYEDSPESPDGSGDRESAPEESGTDDGGLVSVGATELNDSGSEAPATAEEPGLFKL